MGEKKHSVRAGGGTSFLVQWEDTDDTVHKCSWEPESNLTHCTQLMKEWYQIGLSEQKGRLTEAKTIGIMALNLTEKKLSETETLIITDLSQSECDYSTTIEIICEKAGILPSQILLIWASPPCNTVSPAGALNQSREVHYRIHSDPHLPPRDDDSKCARLARKHDSITGKVTKALCHSIEQQGTYSALENPRKGLERLPFMKAPRWRSLTEKKVVDYCAWKHPYKKPENIWVSEFGWIPTGTTGDGRCGDNCESGSLRSDTDRYRHHKVLSGPTGTGPTGKGIEKQKNAVPHLLLKEILQAVKQSNTDPNRRYVLDLFAGYDSMRFAAAEEELKYIAVDERDLMSAASPQSEFEPADTDKGM